MQQILRPKHGVRGGQAGRAGGLVAIVVSILWALTGAGTIVAGLNLWASGSAAGGWGGGWGELLGVTIVAIGVAVVIAAVVGVVLGIRLMRDRGGVGPAVYFGLVAGASGVVLALDVFGETGPEPWALGVLLNVAACSVVTVLAIRSAAE